LRHLNELGEPPRSGLAPARIEQVQEDATVSHFRVSNPIGSAAPLVGGPM